MVVWGCGTEQVYQSEHGKSSSGGGGWDVGFKDEEEVMVVDDVELWVVLFPGPDLSPDIGDRL